MKMKRKRPFQEVFSAFLWWKMRGLTGEDCEKNPACIPVKNPLCNDYVKSFFASSAVECVAWYRG